MKIIVYNSYGQIVKLVQNNSQNQGQQANVINCSDLKSGVYYCKILTDDYSETKKILLVK
ncbi:MAG: T9SS type A sorting domain-containing protein [Bacteroidetes bacterium]|nr:T9SS type A sorting domain-containing protein [Bacteroidota bacterium]